MPSAEIGLGWRDGWPAEWEASVPGLEVADATERVASNLVKVVRRWMWRGAKPLEKATLAVRVHVPGDAKDLKPFLPGVLTYGNPSNAGRTDGRVPVYAGEPGEFAQFEEHRLPMPFALLENVRGGDFTAVHVLPSPVRGAAVEDLWWSVGVEARADGADVLLLSGPVGYNRRRGVVKATQGAALAYPPAYVTLQPGQVVEKTFWIQTGRATSEAFGFEQALDVSLDLFEPYDASRFATRDEIVRRKRAYALTRWREWANGACGFDMYEKASGHSAITIGWCGCAATCGYALPALDLDPADWKKAQRSLDFLAKTFAPTVRPDGLFDVVWDPASNTTGGGDPVSCGQGLRSIVKAIRLAQRSGGRLDATAWRAFAAASLEGVARHVLADGWAVPKSTACGFLVAPLVEGGELFGKPDWIRAAKKIAAAFEKTYFGYEHVYWGGTLDASCEDKEGAYAALQGYVALLRHAVRAQDAAAERRYARLARHALNMMLAYVMVWDATYPPGRLADHAFKSTGWTVVSAQNQHLDAFGALTTPDVAWMGRYLKDDRLVRLADVMYRSCFQLTAADGSLGEQIQQTNFAQRGDLSDVRKLRGGYAEGWTVFWLTAHFLNAAADLQADERVPAVVPEKPAGDIIYNTDGCDVLYWPNGLPETAENFQRQRLRYALGTRVKTVSYCPISAGFGRFTCRFAGEPATNDVRYGVANTHNATSAFFAQGTDSLQMAIDFCRSNDLEIIVSVRVNDQHDVDRSHGYHDLYPQFKYDHPECLMGSFDSKNEHLFDPWGLWSCVDFTQKIVRDRMRTFVRELVENYDVDGIEYDFDRHLMLFKSVATGGVASDADRALMTDLMRDLRAATQAVAKKRGRPFRVLMRMPDTVAYCRECGIDLERWLEEKLLDDWIGGGYFQLAPWNEAVAVAHRHGVRFHASMDESRIERKSRDWKLPFIPGRGTEAAYAARFAQARAAGCDGIYLFNCEWDFMHRVAQFDVAATRSADQLYFATYLGSSDYTANSLLKDGIRHMKMPQVDPGPGPRGVKPVFHAAGATFAFLMWFGEFNAASGAAAPHVAARALANLKEGEVLELRVNGKTLAAVAGKDGLCSYDLAAESIHCGRNEFSVTFPKRDGSYRLLDFAVEIRH